MKTPPIQLTAALDLYCEWLNKWTHSEGYGPPNDPSIVYEPANFLSDEYASWHDCGHLGGGFYDIHNFVISDGDDGGPTELTVWWDSEDQKVIHIIQGFDTYVTSVYDREKGFLHTP